jgi:hypothetical protein
MSRCSHASDKGEKYSSYSFLTSALGGISSQRHAPSALYPLERTPDTHWTGVWLGLRAGLDTEDTGKNSLRLPEIEPRWPGRPVCSQTLHYTINNIQNTFKLVTF